MASEKEKMLSELFYDVTDPQLAADRKKARSYLHRLNTTNYGDANKYSEIISKLLPNCASDIWIEPPFFCDYGYNIYAGHRVYFNFNCIVLDVCSVRIGSNVMFGPGVHIYTATHPNATQAQGGVDDRLNSKGKGTGEYLDTRNGGGSVDINGRPELGIGARQDAFTKNIYTRDNPYDCFIF